MNPTILLNMKFSILNTIEFLTNLLVANMNSNDISLEVLETLEISSRFLYYAGRIYLSDFKIYPKIVQLTFDTIKTFETVETIFNPTKPKIIDLFFYDGLDGIKKVEKNNIYYTIRLHDYSQDSSKFYYSGKSDLLDERGFPVMCYMFLNDNIEKSNNPVNVFNFLKDKGTNFKNLKNVIQNRLINFRNEKEEDLKNSKLSEILEYIND